MAKNSFKYKVNLTPLKIDNTNAPVFRDKLKAIPYLLYEVEHLCTGKKIVINKPGGKRNFGRLSRDDIAVYIYDPTEESLWLISHREILDELISLHEVEPDSIAKVVAALFYVCNGEDPDVAIEKFCPPDCKELTCETILKVYKWIWGQEDCNYPTGEGRWLSMNGILNQFGFSKDDMETFLNEGN